MTAPRLDMRQLQGLELVHRTRPLTVSVLGQPGAVVPLIPGAANADGPALMAELIRLARLGAHLERTADHHPETPAATTLRTVPPPMRWSE